MASPIPTIVVALIQRGSWLLLVEVQGPDDPTPVWMLPGGQVEAGEGLLDALGRELAEETRLQIIGEASVRLRGGGRLPHGHHHRPVSGSDLRLRGHRRAPASRPDGLVRSAAWVESGDALERLSMLEWYECEPLHRFLSGGAVAGTAYRYRVSGTRGSMIRDRLKAVDVTP